MTSPMKMKLLEELLSHLSSSQGMDLKALLDESKMPKEDPMAEVSPLEEMDKPALSVEKVSVMDKPEMDASETMDKMADAPGSEDEEMNDEELEELLKRALA